MTEERLKLYEEAEIRINAIIDTLSQDKGGLADKLGQEDVKDFLVSLWVDCSAEKDKQLSEAREIIKRLHDCLLQDDSDEETRHYIIKYMTEAEQF